MATTVFNPMADKGEQRKLAQEYLQTLSNRRKEMDSGIAKKLATSEFIYNKANEIYYKSDDPRESASADLFIRNVRESVPQLSEEYLRANYRNIIKQATGNDLGADGLMEVFGQKVAEGYKSFWAGINAIGFEIENHFKNKEASQYEIDERKKKQDAYIASIAGKVRTDYYNEYDGFVQKAILGLGDTLPSLLNSTPAILGAFVGGYVGINNPLLGAKIYKAGKYTSDVLNFVMEYGSLVQTLRQTNATPEQILTASGIYAVLSTAVEHNFDKVPETLISQPLGQLLSVYRNGGKLGTKKVAESVMKIVGGRAVKAGASWLSETGEEVVQQLAEDLVTNILSSYREAHNMDALPEEITATPEEMRQHLIETGKQMGTTQSLLSVLGMLVPLGFDITLGDIKHISTANRYTSRNNNSTIDFVGNVLHSENTDYKPQENGKGKLATTFDAIKGRDTSIGFIPNTEEGFNQASYIYSKGKNNALNVEHDTSEVKGDKATRSQAMELIGDMITEDSNKKEIGLQYTTDGKIKVADSQIGDLLRTLIASHYNAYEGIQETKLENGRQFDVTIGGTTYTFTTDDSVYGEQVTTSALHEHIDQRLRESLEAIDKSRMKQAEDRKNALGKAMDEYLAKTPEQRREELLNQAKNTMIRQGYSGDELKKQTSALINFMAKNQAVLDKQVGKINERGILKRGVSAESFVTSINNQLASTFTTLSKRFGKDMAWVNDHVTIDDSFERGVTIDKDEEGIRLRKDYGYSYWTDGTKTDDGKIQRFQNFRDLKNKDKAKFHIAITDLVDQTTAVHEAGHMFVSLGEASLMKDAQFKRAFRTALEEDNKYKGEDGKWHFKPEDEWVLGDNTHEMFCEKLEAYVNTGMADNAEQVSIFKSVLASLRNLWKAVAELLSKDQQEFFDKLFDASNDTVYNEIYDANGEVSEGVRNKSDEIRRPNGEVRYKSSFDTYALSDSDMDKLYSNFYKSYMDAVGSSWSKDEFEHKSRLWTFWGSVDGGVAARHQNSGLWKLNASYGSLKEIFKGFNDMIDEIGDEPIWGAMTENVADLLEKASSRRGVDNTFMKVPNSIAKMIVPFIGKVFGGNGVSMNSDGTLTATTPDGKKITKVLIANNAYYRNLIDTMRNRPDTLPIPSVVQKLAVGQVQKFYDKNFKQDSSVRHKMEIDYVNDHNYNRYRIRNGMLDMDVAIERDIVYADEILNDMAYIIGRDIVKGLYIETFDPESDNPYPFIIDEISGHYGERKLEKRFGDNDPSKHFIRADIEIAGSEQWVFEYLEDFANDSDSGKKIINLPDGLTLTINPIKITKAYDENTQKIRQLTRLSSSDIVLAFQKAETILWGDVHRITGHHSLAKFDGLDVNYAFSGLGSQAYERGNYTATSKNVNLGYRNEMANDARSKSINERRRKIEGNIDDILNHYVLPRYEQILDKLNDRGLVLYDLRPDGVHAERYDFNSVIPEIVEDIEPIVVDHLLDANNGLEVSHNRLRRIISKAINNTYPEVSDSTMYTVELAESWIFSDVAKAIYGVYPYELTDEQDDGFTEIRTLIDNSINEYLYGPDFDMVSIGEKLIAGRSKEDILKPLARQLLARVNNSIRDNIAKEYGADKQYEVGEHLKSDRTLDCIIEYMDNSIVFEAVSKMNKDRIRDVLGSELYSFQFKYGLDDFFEVLSEDDVHHIYSEYGISNQTPLVYFYVVESSGEDYKYLKWTEPLPQRFADAIYDKLMEMDLDDYHKDEVRAILDSSDFSEVYRMLRRIFEMQDEFVSDRDYEVNKANGNLDGVVRSSVPVSNLLSSMGIVGHTTPHSFTYGNNTEYTSPNYVTYNNESTNTVLRQGLSDGGEDAPVVDEKFYNEKNARYKREYERASIDKDLSEGKPVDRWEINRYNGESEWARAEENAQRLLYDGSMQWASNLFQQILKEYLGDKPFVYSELTDDDWRKITDNWQEEIQARLNEKTKTQKEKLSEKLDLGGTDPIKVTKRLASDMSRRSESATVRAWLNQYTGKNGKAGDKNIIDLARKVNAWMPFENDRKEMFDGLMLSERFPYLDWLLQYEEKNHQNHRRKIRSAIWEGAEHEVEKNAELLYKIDQETAPISAEEDDSIENTITDTKFANYKVKQIRELVSKVKLAKQQAEYDRDELLSLDSEARTLRQDFYDKFEKIKGIAHELGIKDEDWTTYDQLIDLIEGSQKYVTEFSEQLGENYIKDWFETKERIDELEERMKELNNDILNMDESIENQKITLRAYESKIDEQASTIESLTDQLNDVKVELLVGDTLYTKMIKDLQKKLKKATEKYGKVGELREKLSEMREKLDSANEKISNAKMKADKIIQNNKLAGGEGAEEVPEGLYDTVALLGRRLNRALNSLDRQISDYMRLDEKYQKTYDDYSALKRQTMIDASKRKWRRLLERKSGDADRQRAMREFSKAFFQQPDAKHPWRDLVITPLMKSALSNTLEVLSNIGFVSDDTLAKGFIDLAVDKKVFKSIYEAIKEDSEGSKAEQEARERDMRSRMSVADDMIEEFYNHKLSREYEKQAQQDVNAGKYKNMSEARRAIVNDNIKHLHEGSEEYRKQLKKMGYNRFSLYKNYAFASVESLWNMTGRLSKKLQDALFFEYTYKTTVYDADGKPKLVERTVHGLNRITNDTLNERFRRTENLHKEVLTKLGQWTDDQRKNDKAWAKFMEEMNKTYETGQLDPSQVPQSLLNNPDFIRLAYEEQDGEIVESTDADTSYLDKSFNLQEILAIYIHAKGEDGSLDHIVNARTHVSPWQIAYIVKEVEDENGKFNQWKEIADIIQKAYEEKYPQIAEISNRVNNKSLAKVDIYLPLNGATESKDVDITLDGVFGNQEYTGNARIGAGNPSFTKERSYGTNPINLNFVSEFDRVVASQEYFINGADFFSTWNNLLNSKGGGLKLAIQQAFGMNTADVFVKNLQACKEVVPSDLESGMNKYVNTIRNNMALANLGFNLSSMLQQPFVWFLGASKFGYGRMLRAMNAYRQYGSITAWKEHLFELAPQIRDTTNMQIGYAKEAVQNSTVLKGLKKVGEIGMKGIEYFDELTRCIMFEAGLQYYKEMKDSAGNLMYDEKQASERAIQDVMNMNSSRQAKDNSLIYDFKNPYWKALILFTNQLNKQWNMFIGEDGIQALFDKRYKQFIGTVLGLGLATTGVLLAKGKLLNNAGDDDEWWKDMMKDFFTESVEMVPIIGDEISSAINGYSYLDSNVISSTVKFAQRVSETISQPTTKNKRKTVTATKNMANDFLTLVGVPKYIPSHTYNALFERGEYVGDRFFDDLSGVGRIILPPQWWEYITKEIYE